MAERSLRGSGLGSKSFADGAGVEFAARQETGFDCPKGHHFSITFAEEADRFAPGWVIVFAASLAGRAGQPPGAAEADAPLERMVAMVKAGDIGSLLPLNRQGVAVRLG